MVKGVAAILGTALTGRSAKAASWVSRRPAAIARGSGARAGLRGRPGLALPPHVGPCEFSGAAGSGMRFSATTEFAGRRFELEHSKVSNGKQTRLMQRSLVGGELLFEVSAVRDRRAGNRGTVRFGPATGLRSGSLSTTDGRRFAGEVNGRAIVPFIKGTNAIRFADGDRRPQNLIRDDEQYATLRRIRTMRADGQSLRRIVAWLNENGVKTPRGSSKWFVNTLHQVLTSKAARELEVA